MRKQIPPPDSWPALYVGRSHDHYGFLGWADEPRGWDGRAYRLWRFTTEERAVIAHTSELEPLPDRRQERGIWSS